VETVEHRVRRARTRTDAGDDSKMKKTSREPQRKKRRKKSSARKRFRSKDLGIGKVDPGSPRERKHESLMDWKTGCW